MRRFWSARRARTVLVASLSVLAIVVYTAATQAARPGLGSTGPGLSSTVPGVAPPAGETGQEPSAAAATTQINVDSPATFWQLSPEHIPAHVTEHSPALEAHIEAILATMSDEERVAQLLMVSWADEEPTPEIMRWIRERNVGGVKVFGWNGENLGTLAQAIQDMQRASLETETAIPLFTATDQEGGWVRHIKDGTSITPGNMAIGASALPYDSYMTGV